MAALGVMTALLILAAPAGAAPAFSVSPLRFDVNGDPGSSSTHTITITNTLGERLSFSVGSEDIGGVQGDPKATPVLLGGTIKSPISAAAWLVPADRSFALAAGESKALPIRVNIPAGSKGGHYAAVTVSAEPRRISDSLTAQSRVATLFLINAGGALPPEVRIDEVVTKVPGETRIVFTNPSTKKGATALEPKVEIEYVDPVTGKVVGRGTSDDCGVALPGATAECRISDDAIRRFGSSPSGFESGTARIVSNDGVIAKAPIPTKWSGSRTSAALPLAGLALLLLFFVRVRRRAEPEDDELDTYPVA